MIQRLNANGKVVLVSNNSHFHFALEMPKGRTSFEMAARLKALRQRIVYGPVKHNSEPGGDGESGGNVAVYTYDPDGHYVEFFYDMDTIENYKARYGTRTGSERA